MAKKAEAPTQAPGNPAAGQPIDDGGVKAAYANFCRVMSNPEELILDFGLQRELTDRDTPVKITQRVVLSHTNGQRLLDALMQVMRQHNAVFAPQQPIQQR